MKAKLIKYLKILIPPRSEAGQSIVIVALAFVGLMIMAGLATDVGILWYNKSELDAYADAAALAGGEELTRADPAREKAEQYLYLNNVISGTDGIEVDIKFGRNRIDNDVIVVDLYKDQQLAIMSLAGFKTARLRSHAAAYATTWATEDAWGLFRGGCGRTGYRSETGSYTESTGGDFKVQYYWGFRWDLKGDTENHRSTPVVAMHPDVWNNEPIAYVGTNGNKGAGGGVLAFSGVTSDTLWYANLGTMVRSSPYFLDDPAVIANFSPPHTNIPAVIVAGHNGHEYALNALTGAIIWDIPGINADGESGGEQKYRSSPAYSCGSITIGGYTGGVIFNATGGGNVYAYNAQTGAILWRSSPDPTVALTGWDTTGDDVTAESRNRNTGPMYATVNYVNNQDFIDAGYPQGIVFVASFGIKDGSKPYLYAINVATGQGVWQAELYNASCPASKEYTDRNSNAIAKIDTDRDGTPDEWRVYANPTDPCLYAYKALDGAPLWAADTGADNHRSDPAIYKNIVFGGNNEGVYAIDAVAGFSIWDDVDSDGAGDADKVNPYYSIETNPGGSNAFATATKGTRLIPGGVKSAPAIVDGIVMVGANKTSTGANGGSMWAMWWEDGHVLSARQTGDPPQPPDFNADDNDPPFDTTAYDGDGPCLDPTCPNNSKAKGDVRSGVVVGPDGNIYFGAQDGVLYQLYISRRLILIE